MHNPWAAHPYHAAYWRAFHRRRGGSRLLWFLIGAGTATLWIKAHHAHGPEWHTRHCGRDRIPQDAYPPPSAAQGQADDLKREKELRRWGWWGSREQGAPWQSPPPQVQQAQAQAQTASTSAPPQPAPPTPHVLPPPMPTDRWDEERMRVQQLGKQATETISELSEATLDSVLATVQSLKVKLAEARKEREQHLQQMQSLKDEQAKLFEEWRKQHESQQQQQTASQSPKPRYPVDFSPPS